MNIGFSTSSFYKIPGVDTRQAISLCRALGCSVIELNAGRPERIEWLKQVKREDVAGFSFVSIHALSTRRMATFNKAQQRDIISFFVDMSERLNVNRVLFHPGECLGDYSILEEHDFPVSIENMDQQNTIGTTVESMKRIIGTHNFNVTIDLNHCYTHDKTMRLAHDFQQAFNGKISHYHLSDYGGLGEDKLHIPFFKGRHDIILQNIPDRSLPIILEESLLSKEEAKIELEYLSDFLK